MLSEYTDNDSLSELNHGTVIIDFYATWCPPCKAMSPILGELASTMPEVDFLQVDVDQNRGLVERFQVASMPTFVKLVDGVEVDRVIGATSKDKFKEFVG